MESPGDDSQYEKIRDFYDNTYYKSPGEKSVATAHHLRLVKRLGVKAGDEVLDVACGAGGWLSACKQAGANVSGVDISAQAINVCKSSLPGNFFVTPAEQLPFADATFDVVTCLGSLEHFIDPDAALKEMCRVAKASAQFTILVPNADFLTRKLGLFMGTYQVDAKEDVKRLDEWNALFERSGLQVTKRWKDLHVLSWHWISIGKWYQIPLRLAQALALSIWPLHWQYQVYHLCVKKTK